MKCLTRSTVSRTAATAAVLLLGVACLTPFAGAAGIAGRASGTEAVSTASWGVTASVTSMNFNFNVTQTTNVVNTGTVALSAQSYVVSVSRPFFFAPTFTIFGCSVPWVGGTCSGGRGTQIGRTLYSGSTTTITSAAALAPGATDYLKVVPAGVFLFTTTVTLTPEVTAPAQVRAPIRTNQ